MGDHTPKAKDMGTRGAQRRRQRQRMFVERREEGGEEDQAQRDGRTVQVELGQRDGQLVAESLRFRWAVTVTFPAANSDMASETW